MEKKRKYQAIIISITVLVVLAGIATAIYFGNSKEAEEEKPDKELVEIAEQGRRAFEDGNYIKSLNLCLDFVNKAEHNPKIYGQHLVDTYFDLGVIYAYFNDLHNSLQYNLKSYDLATRIKYYFFYYANINNIAEVYQELGDYKKAAEFNDKLLTLNRVYKDSVNRDRIRGLYYATWGEIKAKSNNEGDPIEDWEKAYKLLTKYDLSKTRSGDVVAEMLNAIASYYDNKGQDKIELSYLMESINVAKKNVNSKAAYMSSVRGILNYYIKKGDERNSLKYGKEYLSLLDSSMSAKRFIEAKNAQEQYEQKKAEEKIQSMSITVSKHRLVAILAIAALVIAMIILTIILRQKRRMQEAYRGLYKMNLEVMGKKVSTIKEDCKTVVQEETEDKASEATSQQQNKVLYERILKLMEDPAVYCASDFNLMKLVSLLDSNITYVSKVINENFGQNVPTFINTYRINEARRKITDTATYGNLTLQAIAESVGYNNQVSFNRAFKQITGMTPSVFQKMTRESQNQAKL